MRYVSSYMATKQKSRIENLLEINNNTVIRFPDDI